MRAFAALMAVGVASGGCGGDSGELRIAGESGYVRCLAADPPPARSWRAGALRLTTQERSLRIEGAPSSARIAVFAGPLAGPIDGASVRALRNERPHLALVLGGLGEGREEAAASLSALAELGAPALVLAGGGDEHAALAHAFEQLEGTARDRVVNVSVLRSVRVGALELVPVAGAPLGRYALSNGACGFAEDDVERIAGAVGEVPAGVERVVLSWASPSGPGVDGVGAGSPQVARLAARVGARGSVSAWPPEGAGASTEGGLRVIVRALAGPFSTAADGSRMRPGATLLTLDPEGLSMAAGSP